MCEKQAAAVQSGRLKDSAARCKMQGQAENVIREKDEI